MHPQYLVDEEDMAVIRMARLWREGVLPEAGGVQDQAAITVASIEIVLNAWAKLEAAARRKKDRS